MINEEEEEEEDDGGGRKIQTSYASQSPPVGGGWAVACSFSPLSPSPRPRSPSTSLLLSEIKGKVEPESRLGRGSREEDRRITGKACVLRSPPFAVLSVREKGGGRGDRAFDDAWIKRGMASGWFGSWRSKGKRKGKEEEEEEEEKGKAVVVLDGSDIKQLVEDPAAFGGFAETKFQELDADGDGRLSVQQLKPAVADIGAALGIPVRQLSSEFDRRYAQQVVHELTQGKQEVSKTEFKEVLWDVLVEMAAGLKRDPIVILRIDGEDLKDFVESIRFEPEAIAIFESTKNNDSTATTSSSSSSSTSSLRNCLTSALRQLTVDHGMPPSSDSWVLSNIVEPCLRLMPSDVLEKPASREMFLVNFKRLLGHVIRRLQGHPVIVAHSESTFDGSGIKRLISNKFELDKLLDKVWREVPPEDRNHHQKAREYLRNAIDGMAASANLPPRGAVDQVDALVSKAIDKANADGVKIMEEAKFKKTLAKILENIMVQLEGNPMFVSTNTVVNDPAAASSATPLPTSPPAQ